MTVDDSHIKELTTVFEMLKTCLPLGHWKVALHFSSADEMEDIGSSPTCYGVTKIKENMEFANIYINRDALYQEWDTPLHTLVHEFVHVMLYPFHSYIESTHETNDYFMEMLEQYVNHMAEGIVNLLKLE